MNNLYNLYNLFDKIWIFLWDLRYFIYSFLVILSIFIIIIFILIQIYLYKYIKRLFTRNCTASYHLTDKSRQKLDEFGDYKIKRVILIKYHINLFLNIFIHFTTILNYNITPEFPKHSGIILELELPYNTSKLLLIDKNPNIRLLDNFNIFSNTEYMSLNVEKPITLNEVVTKTKKIMGKKNFFSWNMLNNCQNFSLNILKTLHLSSNEANNFLNQKHLRSHLKKYREFYKLELFLINLNHLRCQIL